MTQPLVDGETLRMGGEDWIIAPLSFRSLEKLDDSFSALNGADNKARMAAFIAIVYECLLRNYPDITLDRVKDLLDMRNARTVVDAILASSGFVKQAPGGASSGPLTGTPSIAESSPQPDGPGNTSANT